MAMTLVHELGHYLGLGHRTANGDQNNIMFETGTLSTDTPILPTLSLWNDQVREMQDRLANNLARKNDREQ